jgi:hypothetical protein
MTISSRKATDKIFDGLLDDQEKGEDYWYYQGDNDYEEWTGTGAQHQCFDMKVGVGWLVKECDYYLSPLLSLFLVAVGSLIHDLHTQTSHNWHRNASREPSLQSKQG